MRYEPDVTSAGRPAELPQPGLGVASGAAPDADAEALGTTEETVGAGAVADIAGPVGPRLAEGTTALEAITVGCPALGLPDAVGFTLGVGALVAAMDAAVDADGTPLLARTLAVDDAPGGVEAVPATELEVAGGFTWESGALHAAASQAPMAASPNPNTAGLMAISKRRMILSIYALAYEQGRDEVMALSVNSSQAIV